MSDERVSVASDAFFDYMYKKWNAAWDRFGEHPRLDGVRFLDFGCGLGAFSVHAAQEGAQVVGLDIDSDSIVEAKSIVARRFSDLDITYTDTHIEELDGTFDVVMTNEVLEHVVDLAGCLEAVRNRLRPGGTFFAGWGPLWYSPTGGHQLTIRIGKFPIPWSHLIGPIATAQSHKHTWTFNYFRPSDYEAIIAASGLQVLSWRVNPGAHPIYRALRAASRVAPTPFTANVYTVLRRTE
ncbi:MAG: methyltransferase domain-containing protein [Acidimicrobiales bacterium]|jgi:SAM-dependent methyltransferase